MRVAIVDSRPKYWRDPKRIKNLVWLYVNTLPPETEVVSGGAQGPDTWGITAAEAFGLKTKVFAAKWDELGKSAGSRRNETIVQYLLSCPHAKLVAFWDGKSRGTEHVITYARYHGVPVQIVTG